jgi:two-component system CheB/CheR fusion protein
MSANSLKLDDIFVLSIILTDVTIRNENQEELKNRTEQLQKKNLELENINKTLEIQNEEKKKRTAELSDANKDIKELEKLIAHKESILTILSHDLRSPLSGIIGTTEFLKSNFEEMDHEEVKTMLDLLCESSKDELKMLDYLVEWARIKYASEAFAPTKIELVQYVNKVFESLSDIAAVNAINLHHEIEENTNVFADKKMLISVLQNIVSNAIKHSHPGGKITVSTKRNEDKIIVEIKDTGMGMTKEIQKKLFTPQMEALSEERKDNKGAGIGLLLVKGLLEKSNGEIWVESTLGLGSSFYFTLPVDKPLHNPLRKKIQA